MRLTLFDPNSYKFTKDMMEHWQKNHEFETNVYYNPRLVKWADTVWFDTCDNNLHQATQETIAGETAESVKLKDKHVICRVIDIEAWCGQQKGVNWEYVDDVIFLAPHIKELVERDIDFNKTDTRVHVIPCGVNTDKFNFREKPNEHKIAWVAHRWHAKGVDLVLQLALKLKGTDFRIYAVGPWAIEPWFKAYVDYFIDQNQLDNMEFIEQVPDMNEWLDNMDYALCASKKETFSYAIAEGMSKGLKPLIHNFYGADKIWDKKYIWNSIDECVEMLKGEFNPKEYRDYIEQNYSLKKMLKRFDEDIFNRK